MEKQNQPSNQQINEFSLEFLISNNQEIFNFSKEKVRQNFKPILLLLTSITPQSLTKLNAQIFNCSNENQLFIFGLIYLAILDSVEWLQMRLKEKNQNIAHLEELEKNITRLLQKVPNINALYEICQKLYGSFLANRLNFHIFHLMEAFGKTQNKSFLQVIDMLKIESQKIGISQLSLNFEAAISNLDILENALNPSQKIQVIQNYCELLSQCSSLDEQAIIFGQYSHLVFKRLFVFPSNIFPNVNFLEKILHLAKSFLITNEIQMFMQDFEQQSHPVEEGYGFLNKQCCKDTNEDLVQKLKQEAMKRYKIQKIIMVTYTAHQLSQCCQKHNQISYFIILEIIDFLILHVNFDLSQLEMSKKQSLSEIQLQLFELLEKMFDIFKQKTEEVLQRILKICLVHEKAAQKETPPFYIVLFLAKLIKEKFQLLNTSNEDNFLYQKLQNLLPILMQNAQKILSSNFEKQQMQLRFDRNPGFDFLFIEYGFPLEQIIKAGGSFEYIIEIWKPESIIHWSFATKDYNIGFQFQFLGPFINSNLKQAIDIIDYQLIDSHQFLVKGSFITKFTGLYRFIFNNKASWFHQKTLRYRIYVLEPNDIPNLFQFPLYSSDRMKEIEIQSQQKEETMEQINSQNQIFQTDRIQSILHISNSNIKFFLKIKDKENQIFQAKLSKEQIVSHQPISSLHQMIEDQKEIEGISNKISLFIVEDAKRSLQLEEFFKSQIQELFLQGFKFFNINLTDYKYISLFCIIDEEKDIIQKLLEQNDEDDNELKKIKQLLKVWLDFDFENCPLIFCKVQKYVSVLRHFQQLEIKNFLQHQNNATIIVVELRQDFLKIYDLDSPQGNYNSLFIEQQNKEFIQANIIYKRLKEQKEKLKIAVKTCKILISYGKNHQKIKKQEIILIFNLVYQNELRNQDQKILTNEILKELSNQDIQILILKSEFEADQIFQLQQQ